LKIACVSDVHGKLAAVQWPKADVLILGGDILPNLSRVLNSDVFMQTMWLEETFAPLIQKLLDKGVYDHIVMTPGNHDKVFAYNEKEARAILNRIRGSFHLLINEDAIIDGKVFWGSPMSRWFYGQHWVFNFPDHNANFARARAHSRNCWELIPDDVEVLITHGPALGILDECANGDLAGCPWLKERMCELKNLKLHVVGHIHEAAGQKMWSPSPLSQSEIICVNASICTLAYKPTNLAQVVTI